LDFLDLCFAGVFQRFQNVPLVFPSALQNDHLNLKFLIEHIFVICYGPIVPHFLWVVEILAKGVSDYGLA